MSAAISRDSADIAFVWVKPCGCGRAYGIAAWSALAYVGRMPSGEEGVELELRNCVCGSTISIETLEENIK